MYTYTNMSFSESLKLDVKQRSAFRCCRCQSIGVEIHHIIPQADKGPDTIENAAPLCPSCHDYFGANPVKRKEIREMREWWFERVANERIARDKVEVQQSVKTETKSTQIVDLSTLKKTNLTNLRQSPITHDFLPQSLINRIKIIYLLTKDYLSTPLDKTIENFRRDQNPIQEVEVWERIINVITSLEKNHEWQKSKIKEALKLSLVFSTGPESDIDMSKIVLNKPEIELVKSLWGNEPIVPITVSSNLLLNN